MKKLMFPVLFLVFLIQIASAQEKKIECVVGGGIDSPLRPDKFSDEFNLGWTAKLAAGYFLSPRVTVGANLSFNRFGLDKGTFVTLDNSGISGGGLSIFEFAAVGKYHVVSPQSKMSVYVLGGPGAAYSRTSDLNYTNIAGLPVTIEGNDATDFMITAGAGVKYNLNQRWGLILEGRYSNIFTEGDNTSYLPIRVGVVF